MQNLEIMCYVEPLGQQYADGLERVELYVCSEYSGFVPSPEPGQGLPVNLFTPQGSYRGGLRKYRGGSTYLCPDLTSDKDGRKVSLARVLQDNGFAPRQRVAVCVDDGNWRLKA